MSYYLLPKTNILTYKFLECIETKSLTEPCVSFSLANYLYEKISEYQNDDTVRKEKPMQWPAGIYFTEKKLEEWIEEHGRAEK